MTPNHQAFVAILTLLMGDDNPSVLTEQQRDELGNFADGEAHAYGYANWVEAYHKLAVTSFDFHAHLQRQADWSRKTFGPDPRTAGVIDHIRKELHEIEAKPNDLSEWIDVVILALDGAWRMGATPNQIIAALVAKQTKNESRNWPDWRTAPADRAIEHVREGE